MIYCHLSISFVDELLYWYFKGSIKFYRIRILNDMHWENLSVKLKLVLAPEINKFYIRLWHGNVITWFLTKRCAPMLSSSDVNKYLEETKSAIQLRNIKSALHRRAAPKWKTILFGNHVVKCLVTISRGKKGKLE